MHLIESLKSHNIIKTGTFTLKSGIISSLYFDFKSVMSYPKLMADISYELSKLITHDSALCGVPLGGISYTTLVSHILSRPMVLLREEKKDYGMCNLVDGQCDGNVILIEDVITTGQSVIKSIELLKNSNINVKQIVCILDREAGGMEKIKEMGYNVTSLYKMSDILDYEEHNDLIKCNITNKLLDIIKTKQSNLIVSVDCDSLYEVIEIVGPHVCAIKIHSDIYENIDCTQINFLKNKYNFMVIEDRKFADIPYICLKQLEFVKQYADIVTVHALCGELLIQEIGKHVGVLIIHSMSVKDNLIDRTYMNKVLDMKCNNLVGYVSQEKVKNYLTFTPGINIKNISDNKGQCYKNTNKSDSDIFIVGRGIYEGNILENVLTYKKLCWKNIII